MKQWVEGCGMMEVKPAKDNTRIACEWCGKKYTKLKLIKKVEWAVKMGRDAVTCEKCREPMYEAVLEVGYDDLC